MKSFKLLIICCALGFTTLSCIDNNRGQDPSGETQESDYGQEAPTYNNARDDIETNTDSLGNNNNQGTGVRTGE